MTNSGKTIDQYQQDTTSKLQTVQSELSLLKSYPAVEDWVRLLYQYQPLKAHEKRKLRQYQNLVTCGSGLVTVVESEILDWFRLNLKQAGIYNTSLREHLDFEQATVLQKGRRAEGLVLLNNWRHRLNVQIGDDQYEVQMWAHVEGTGFLSSQLTDYNLSPARVLLPSRKLQAELLPVEHAKVIVKTTFKQLNAEMIYVDGQNLPAKQAYETWQANRSWLNRKLYGNFSYQRWLGKVREAVRKQSRYLRVDSDNLNDLITDEVLTDQRQFAQQVKNEFSFLWYSLLGYPEIKWGRPGFRF